MKVIKDGILNGYGGKWGRIWVESGLCDVCEADGVAVLRADTSMEEFYPPGVCLPCATKALLEPPA